MPDPLTWRWRQPSWLTPTPLRWCEGDSPQGCINRLFLGTKAARHLGKRLPCTVCAVLSGITSTVPKRSADTTFDDRSRGQVMADTLVERVTGRPAETSEPVAVNLVISDETLLGGDNSPAVIEGYGPIPASVARSLVDAAVTDERSRANRHRRTARRLNQRALPATGESAVPRSLAAVVWASGVTRFAEWCRRGSRAAALRSAR